MRRLADSCVLKGMAEHGKGMGMRLNGLLVTKGHLTQITKWKIHFASDGLRALAASHWSRRACPDILLTPSALPMPRLDPLLQHLI